jgi:hypothetical protein
MVTEGGSSKDLESIDSNDNRPACSGADRAIDPADAGSVVSGGGGVQPLGGGGGGVQPLGGGGGDGGGDGGGGVQRIGADDGGARSMSDGDRRMENANQSVANSDVRRLFHREVGRPIFDNSRPVITGKKITNRTWIKRKKMTHLSFSERAVWGTVVTINRSKQYAFIRRCGKMVKI